MMQTYAGYISRVKTATKYMDELKGGVYDAGPTEEPGELKFSWFPGWTGVH